MRILIVEDEHRLATTLAEILNQNKYQTDIAYDGEEGLNGARTKIYDVIIMDVMMPCMDGYTVVQTMRQENINTPVLMLTAKCSTDNRVQGLDCGADYYLTKPFEVDELLACIRSLLRRQGTIQYEILTYHDLTLNLSTFILQCGYRSVRLSNREFDMMRILMYNKECIVSKETLLLKIWGFDSNAEDNHVEVYMSFLRKKLAYLKSSVSIVTIRNAGYHLEVNSL